MPWISAPPRRNNKKQLGGCRSMKLSARCSIGTGEVKKSEWNFKFEPSESHANDPFEHEAIMDISA